MASAYSKLHNYDQELYKPNLELINTALQFKQGQYNANKEKLQTMYDRYSFLEVAKGQDQAYLEERLQETKSVMNKYLSLDLSSSNLTSQLGSVMGQVVDDKVKKAVISTKIYNKEQQAWAKLKETSPEKYSQVNQAYANQSAQAWLNDDKIGSMYKGGGGVIEYQDVEGKLSKALPELAKSLKAEWVDLADGNGYFRDLVSKERVDRGKLDAAMEGLLNEKDRRQLQINAWGRYDSLPEGQIDAIYTSHFAPKIKATQDTIKSLKATIAATKEPALKEHRQSILESYQDQLTAYEANSYQNIANTYGKEAAYQTLYDNQFKTPYLDNYSYMDRVTKIATYDNDVKTRNYELNVAKFAETKRANSVRELNAVAKSRAAKINSSGTTYVAPLTGGKSELGYDSEDSKISTQNKIKSEILSKTQRLFGIENLGETRELLKVFNEGWAGKEFIEFKGKKINVQENIDTLLDYQNNVINKSPAEKSAAKEYNSSVDRSLGNLKRVAQGDNPDWDAHESTPRYDFKFVLDKETGYMKKVPVSEGSANSPRYDFGFFEDNLRRGENNYAHLLEKGDLTESEEFTLGVYHKMHILMDPALEYDTKATLMKSLQENEFSRLTNEDFNTLPSSVDEYLSTGTFATSGNYLAKASNREVAIKDGFYERHPKIFGGSAQHSEVGVKGGEYVQNIVNRVDTLYGELHVANQEGFLGKAEQIRSKIQKEELALTRVGNIVSKKPLPDGALFGNILEGIPVIGPDYFLSDITAKDSEFYDIDGIEVSLASPESILTTGQNSANNILESAYKAQDLNPSLRKQIFDVESTGYEKLVANLGLPSGTKEPITLERVWNKETETPTTEVKWSYTKVSGKDKVLFSSEDGKGVGRLDTEQLENNGIAIFSNLGKSDYDASWGENSNVLDLGSNQFDESIHKRNIEKYGGNLGLSIDNTLPLIEDARRFGGEELVTRIKAERQDFINGAYAFKMESINGVWQYSVYKDGQRLYKEPTDPNGVTNYSNEEVKLIYTEAEAIVNNVMFNYLDSIIEEAHNEFKLNYQARQEQEF